MMLRTDPAITRRQLLKGSSALIVSFSLTASFRGGLGTRAALASQAVPGDEPRDVSEDRLDSWLAIVDDGRVIVYCGKVELGTGVKTALSQIVADELGVSFDSIEMIMGDTALTPDQGTTAGSNTIRAGGSELRNAAALARTVLLERAAEQLEVPIEELDVDNGTVTAISDVQQSIPYTDLIGEGFDLTIPDEDEATAEAPLVKDPAEYSIVGQSIPRVDIPGKLTGQPSYVEDLRLDGMVHGRVVRPWLRTPTGVGATLVEVDEDSVSDIPGLIQVVRNGSFLGVVAEDEYQAVLAAGQLQATWEELEPLPDQATLYDYIRELPIGEDEEIVNLGDVEMTLAEAAQTITATYQIPFAAHASMGPSCAVADVRDDEARIYSSTQSIYGLRGAIAGLLGMDEEAVRVTHLEGAGCYGHNGFDDAAADAALLSQAVGRPVRVQWMRQDEFAWELKGPAMVIDVRGGLDDEGNIVAWDYTLWSQSHGNRPSGEAYNLLAGQLVDPPAAPLGPDYGGGGSRNAPHLYSFSNNRILAHWLDLFILRPSALRSLGGWANTTAIESFVDELAAAAGADPVEFRLRHLEDQRAIEVLTRAAELAGWETGPAGPGAAAGDESEPATGRGIALSRYESEFAYVAAVADVTVDRASGQVTVDRVSVAHDCGLIVNPDGLANQIEGQAIQGVSRALKEEVTWDAHQETSLDWASYQILTFPEVPEVQLDLIDRLDQPSVGAGEPAICNVAAAIANAIFDATGARVRTIPFTPERVQQALQATA